MYINFISESHPLYFIIIIIASMLILQKKIEIKFKKKIGSEFHKIMVVIFIIFIWN